MKTRINITIDPEVVEELDRQAKAEGRSRSGMVERLVRHRQLVAESSGLGTEEVDRRDPIEKRREKGLAPPAEVGSAVQGDG